MDKFSKNIVGGGPILGNFCIFHGLDGIFQARKNNVWDVPGCSAMFPGALCVAFVLDAIHCFVDDSNPWRLFALWCLIRGE